MQRRNQVAEKAMVVPTVSDKRPLDDRGGELSRERFDREVRDIQYRDMDVDGYILITCCMQVSVRAVGYRVELLLETVLHTVWINCERGNIQIPWLVLLVCNREKTYSPSACPMGDMTLPIGVQDVMDYADNIELVLGIAPIPGVDKFIMPKAQAMLGELDR